MENRSYEETFTKKIISTGRWTILTAVVLCFLPAIYLWIRYGAIPSVKTILTGWFLIASMYGAFYIVEPISYFPILGLSGTYMSFLSGNIANVRVPASAVAQDALGVDAGSQEAELISTISIAGSIITNLIIVTIGAFAGNAIIGVLPEYVITAFGFVFPAIMGALLTMFALKFYKCAVVGLAVGIIINMTQLVPAWLAVPLCVFVTAFVAIIDYKKQRLNQ
ncbi:hypothetical protein CIW83_12990 [Tissierella sp. P1]|uniref:hypothetical protein n=1 Tax=Tissierella sp. P1 TaxID=1280483 RepID=UPI000BA0CC12|nr:hypothetical protein [Tissierella sp. P1]OZV11773.1 hypothetical protein CIW83_12990 [Tissierella sp. P1]